MVAAVTLPSPKNREPRSDRGADKPRSPRKTASAKWSEGSGGGGDRDADRLSYISRAKSSGISDWHLVTAGGDDDEGPLQPRDPLGPKRFSKFYQ